ncbi:hypothetical protein MRB53_025382 [Persea americana]|uniref:Uncharacterized protein n=1 Tax=Persea americana TaxID=3435 RepID=A0ACC2LFQ7_PERAE|nr:hypothetical protein MRB53_025382 [Persea americana]
MECGREEGMQFIHRSGWGWGAGSGWNGKAKVGGVMDLIQTAAGILENPLARIPAPTDFTERMQGRKCPGFITFHFVGYKVEIVVSCNITPKLYTQSPQYEPRAETAENETDPCVSTGRLYLRLSVSYGHVCRSHPSLTPSCPLFFGRSLSFCALPDVAGPTWAPSRP